MIDKTTWAKIEKEYIRGKKVKDIATKYNASPDYIYHKARAEGWNRKIAEKSQEIAKKTDEKASDIISDALTECYKQAADIVKITAKALTELTQKEYSKSKQERKLITGENGEKVEITEKTEGGYIATSNIQANKLHTLTKTLETAVNILQGVANGADPQKIQLVIDKGDFEQWSK